MRNYLYPLGDLEQFGCNRDATLELSECAFHDQLLDSIDMRSYAMQVSAEICMVGVCRLCTTYTPKSISEDSLGSSEIGNRARTALRRAAA